MDLIEILDYVATWYFAIRGTQITLNYTSSIYLVVIFAVVTANGGGTIRDISFKRKPFWIKEPSYITTSALVSILYLKKIQKI